MYHIYHIIGWAYFLEKSVIKVRQQNLTLLDNLQTLYTAEAMSD